MDTGRKDTIIVVEDEALVALDLQARLRRLGYEVPAVVSTGEQAILMAEKFKPGLMIMDIVLKGGMDGLKAAEIIHSTLDIPIVFLTAYCDDKTLERAKAAEPFGYINKPFEEIDLRVVLGIAFHKAAMESERKELTNKLKKALDEVKTLRGLIPICASCKKIRNDSGFWQAVEQYVEERSDAQFTHGICADCAAKLYPETYKGN